MVRYITPSHSWFAKLTLVPNIQTHRACYMWHL